MKSCSLRFRWVVFILFQNGLEPGTLLAAQCNQPWQRCDDNERNWQWSGGCCGGGCWWNDLWLDRGSSNGCRLVTGAIAFIGHPLIYVTEAFKVLFLLRVPLFTFIIFVNFFSSCVFARVSMNCLRQKS